MTSPLAPPVTDLSWAVPTALALLSTLVAAAVIVVVVRTSRRSPRARAAAEQTVMEAAEALRRLDDAVAELDVAFDAADASDAADLPPELRRSAAVVRRARDRGFAELRELTDTPAAPARRRQEARRLHALWEAQLDRAGQVRSQLDAWTRDHRTTEDLLGAARRRHRALLETAGDPAPLLDALRRRFDPEDREDAEAAARSASEATREAEEALGRAGAEGALHASAATRRAEKHLRAVEDAHRVAFQAAENVDAELSTARDEIATALDVVSRRPGDCAPDAGERLRAAVADLDAASADAARRPRAAVATVARVREVRDLALGEAVSPRRRLEAARTALPGTLACARAALAAADAREVALPISDRLSRERARHELAEARAATDAGQALAHARAAWHAVPAP